MGPTRMKQNGRSWVQAREVKKIKPTHERGCQCCKPTIDARFDRAGFWATHTRTHGATARWTHTQPWPSLQRFLCENDAYRKTYGAILTRATESTVALDSEVNRAREVNFNSRWLSLGGLDS